MGSDVALPPRLLLFDGVCAVCDATVQWVLDHDPAGAFHFAPLQGETAAAVRARHPEWPSELDSLVLVEQTPSGERLTWHSDAIVGLGRGLGGLYGALAAIARLYPRWFRDPAYRTFARIRYRVFGRLEACRIPEPAQAARFLP